MTIRIVSFGYGHGPTPTADLVVDLRALLRNPFHNAELKHRTGLDQEVYDHVMNTPGAQRLAVNTIATARGLAEDTGADVTIAWGCTGGRHRSVGLARASYELLHAVGEEASIEHRDVDQDLLPAGLHNRVRHTDPALVGRDDGRGDPLHSDAPHQHPPHLLDTTPLSPPRPPLRPGA